MRADRDASVSRGDVIEGLKECPDMGLLQSSGDRSARPVVEVSHWGKWVMI